jgi:hypothetical protein
VRLTQIKKILPVTGLILLSVGIPSSLWADAGTTTADILKINDGARPAAMGGAYTAMGDDSYSINYNPAGLALLRSTQVILLHLASLAGISYEYFTFATPAGKEGTVAVNLTYRHEPVIDNQNSQSASFFSTTPSPPVTSDDLLGTLSYARQFSSSFRVGATVKYLKSDLASFSASAVVFDVGAQLDKLPFGIRAGLSVQNFGTGMTFNQVAAASSTTSSEPLPLFIRLGVGTHQVVDPKKDGTGKDLNIGIEIFKPSDQDFKLGIGGEFWVFPDLFAVRGGYKIESLGNLNNPNSPNFNPSNLIVEPNAFQDYTLGFTLTRRFDTDDFSLDVSYNPANFTSTSESTFFFALNMKFNQLRIF